MPNVAKAMLGRHIPVLLHESIDGLNLAPGKVFLDGTFGGGGHTFEVLRRFPDTKVIAIDQDPSAKPNFEIRNSKFEFRKSNFRNLDKVLTQLGIKRVDAILFDLGFSSDQLESSGRGFSFLRDEPLDMRMARPLTPERSDGGRGTEGITAAEMLNTFPEETLELILRGFGEERYSKRIAREIVLVRNEKPLKTTFDLVRVVERVKKRTWRDKIHPATKTFQALRIAVNEELPALEEGLEKGFKALKPGGRFAIISFHSLEDRIVKNFFRELARKEQGLLVTKKPITPRQEELMANPRSRSAKLRIVEKL